MADARPGSPAIRKGRSEAVVQKTHVAEPSTGRTVLTNYRKRIQGEADFWDERAATLLASGRTPLWFDHRRGEDVTSIPLNELKGAGLRANPVLYRAVYGELINHILRAATRTKGRALDLGCGSGWFSLELARRGMSVDGFDIGPTQITIAQRLSKESERSSDPRLHGDFGRTNYRVADLNTVCLEKGRYDVAVSLGTLHHIQRLDRLMREVARSLKPDGMFIFWEFIGYRGAARIVPAFFWAADVPAALLKRLTGRRAAGPRISPFEAVSSRKVLEILGRNFALESLEYRFLFLPALVSRLRIYRLPPRLSLPLVKILDRVDRGLIRSHLFQGSFVLGLARKA